MADLSHTGAATQAAALAAQNAARHSYGRLVAHLAYQFGDIAAAQDALSEAFASALKHWPVDGVPHAPDGWLLTVARRNALQAKRHEKVVTDPAGQLLLATDDVFESAPDRVPDQRLKLMLACAHPAIDAPVRTALMLQVVLGLRAQDIAAAFVVPPAAMAQRLVRAKAKIKLAGIRMEEPDMKDWPDRLHHVLEAIYAAYGLAWDGCEMAAELTEEALFLAELVAALLPHEAEPAGLQALLMFIHARRDARYVAESASQVPRFVPLPMQDTVRWNKPEVDQANRLLWQASRLRSPGPFQLEAAIQSAHCQRLYTGQVPWHAIAHLYGQLNRISPTWGARVGEAVALGESKGAAAALEALQALGAFDEAASYAPYWVARAHWLARAEQHQLARESYVTALGLTRGAAERVYLQERLQEIAPTPN